jgi:signal transduction histidine kinase
MRLRLFLTFSIVMLITILVLGFVLQSNTQTTITTFAQQGGFLGADRIVQELEDYYQENGSWTGVEALVSTSLHTGTGTNGEGASQGQGSGQGMGMGQQNRGENAGLMSGQGMVGQFTLANQNGVVLFSEDPNLPTTLSSDILQNAIAIEVNQQLVGYLVPETSVLDLTDIIRSNLSDALNQSLLPTAIIASAVALLLALVSATVLMRPVHQLTDAARKLAEGDLSQRVPVSGGKELKQLGQTFNQMASSLEQSQIARKAMTADIAHELRTPLSVQRANLEALQDGVYPFTLENLEPIIQQNILLNQLVEDLRTLALTDTETLSLIRSETDPEEFFRQICENFSSHFQSRQIGLTFQTVGDLSSCPRINIDRSRVTQVVNNLLQNAYRHTPDGGNVKMSLGCGADQVTLTIHDSGQGIPEEALPMIFDRFYRADQSRARDYGGAGLGLTIARRLSEAHHGTLSAANHPEGGAVFTLTLPAEEVA